MKFILFIFICFLSNSYIKRMNLLYTTIFHLYNSCPLFHLYVYSPSDIHCFEMRVALKYFVAEIFAHHYIKVVAKMLQKFIQRIRWVKSTASLFFSSLQLINYVEFIRLTRSRYSRLCGKNTQRFFNSHVRKKKIKFVRD